MNILRASSALVAAAMFLATTGQTAAAATATANVGVSATVQATCSVSASPLAFGTYSSAQLDGSTNLSVSCTNGTTYTIALDAGTGAGATTTSRVLTGPSSATLGYTLYSNAGRTSVWGVTTGTDTVGGSGNGSAQTISVYGRITSGQLPTPGSYADTVTATLTY